jgi:uncharacterized membrane protein YfcA
MTIGLLAAALAIASGAFVGLVLGLIGGGGSILAVPLLVYLVGVPSPHIAIGTAAIAVALNAAFGLIPHARLGTVKWPCAIVFSAAGMLGALFGSALGKALDGTKLLVLFGLVMIAVGIAMLRPPGQSALKDVRLTSKTAPQMLPRLLGAGSGVGLLSGFFGIGGGFPYRTWPRACHRHGSAERHRQFALRPHPPSASPRPGAMPFPVSWIGGLPRW